MLRDFPVLTVPLQPMSTQFTITLHCFHRPCRYLVMFPAPPHPIYNHCHLFFLVLTTSQYIIDSNNMNKHIIVNTGSKNQSIYCGHLILV
jgi:hypothetical protein